jgi:hypothetical protein
VVLAGATKLPWYILETFLGVGSEKEKKKLVVRKEKAEARGEKEWL